MPTLSSPDVQREFQHRTLVTALAAALPSGSYSLPSTAGWFAYAPWDQSYYVTAPPSSLDQVLASNLSVVDVIPVGSDPFSVAVDPLKKTVWVTNSGSGNVTVINGTTQHLLGSVKVQSTPEGIAFDSTNGTFYVADNQSDNVTVIRSSTHQVVRTVPVGTHPVGVVWDAATNRVFVSDGGSGRPGETDQVTVIAGSSYAVLANVSVGSNPLGLTIDNMSDTVYVANEGSDNLSVISATSSAVVATVPIVADGFLPKVVDVAFDSLHDVVWVAAGYTAIVVNTTTERAEAELAYDPAGILFNVDNGNVCVSNDANRTFGCFQFSPYLVWDRNVTFAETGLPKGTSWSVRIGAPSYNDSVTQSGNRTSIVIGVDAEAGTVSCGARTCYNYSYSVPAFGRFVATPDSGSAVSYFPLSDLTINLTFTSVSRYDVNFSETGLTSSLQWGVTVGNATSSQATTVYAPSNASLLLPNGSYHYTATGPLGWSSSRATGNITVNGQSVSISVPWRFAGYYSVTFSETGLPPGATWNVVLGRQGSGSNTSTITFLEANGTYAFYVGNGSGYSPSPSNGTVVVRGLSVPVPIAFSVATGRYLVAFNETGLPNGTPWGVTLGTDQSSTTGSSLQFAEPNGTYGFTVDPIRGYTATPRSGTVPVQGAAPSAVTIRFVSTSLYNLTFLEKGLPNGTGWAVSIGNQLVSSVTDQIILIEPNGTYGFVVLPVSGYVTASSGFVTMDGNASVNITFRPQTYPVVVLEIGLPPGTTWSVTIYNRSTGYNATFTTNVTALVFYVPNGTYAIAVQAKGYNVTLSTPSITVAGELLGASPTAVFSSPSTRVSSPAWYQLTGEGWFLVGLGIAVIVVGLLALLSRSRRGRRSEGEEWIQELSQDGGARDLTVVDNQDGAAEHAGLR